MLSVRPVLKRRRPVQDFFAAQVQRRGTACGQTLVRCTAAQGQGEHSAPARKFGASAAGNAGCGRRCAYARACVLICLHTCTQWRRGGRWRIRKVLRGGEPCIVSAHRCCTLRLFCRWHCLGRLRVWRAAQRVVPRLRAPARPASDCRMCTRSGQCRQKSPEDMRRPSGSHRRPGGSRVCLHGQELERVATCEY